METKGRYPEDKRGSFSIGSSDNPSTLDSCIRRVVRRDNEEEEEDEAHGDGDCFHKETVVSSLPTRNMEAKGPSTPVDVKADTLLQSRPGHTAEVDVDADDET